MGCFPKPVDANVTTSIQAYRGLSHIENFRVFVAMSQELHSGLNKACGNVETFIFLGALLLTMEKLKTSCLSTLYNINVHRTQNGG